MKSYQTIYTDLQDTSGDESSGQLTIFQRWINDTQRLVLAEGGGRWKFLETTASRTTVSGTNAYQLPFNSRRILSAVYATTGGTEYPLEVVEDSDKFERILAANLGNGTPQFIYQLDRNRYHVEPAPNVSTSTIRVRFRRRYKDLSLADYTTGTITTATNADETIVGDSTVWTGRDPAEGQWIRIDATTGDYEWYEISSFTDNTNLELVKTYNGISIAAGSETYAIGEFSIIPSEYHDLLKYRPLALFYMMEENPTMADRYWNLYDGGYEAKLGGANYLGGLLGKMLNEVGGLSEGGVIDPTDKVRIKTILDPNDPPSTTLSGFT